MKRLRFLFNGNYKSGLPHWYFNLYDNKMIAGEIMILENNAGMIYPLLQPDNTELLDILFMEAIKFNYKNDGVFPKYKDLIISTKSQGNCILCNFWTDNRWENIRVIIKQILVNKDNKPLFYL